MTVELTKFEGLIILTPNVYVDDRGYFMESYNREKFQQSTGLQTTFVQDNESKSQKGTLRGLHYQKPPYAQAKLARVIQGEILDIVVDLRTSSKTFGQSHAMILSESNKLQLYIPRGFGHGFVVLSDTAVLSYKVDNFYSAHSDSGIIWNDETLNIDWTLNPNEVLLSEKDKNLKTFKTYQEQPIFR